MYDTILSYVGVVVLALVMCASVYAQNAPERQEESEEEKVPVKPTKRRYTTVKSYRRVVA